MCYESKYRVDQFSRANACEFICFRGQMPVCRLRHEYKWTDIVWKRIAEHGDDSSMCINRYVLDWMQTGRCVATVVRGQCHSTFCQMSSFTATSLVMIFIHIYTQCHCNLRIYVEGTCPAHDMRTWMWRQRHSKFCQMSSFTATSLVMIFMHIYTQCHCH